MAWSIPTYAGVRATGQPSNYRIAMFELCRAINEREAAIGIPLSTFAIASGSPVSNPTMAQLENLRAFTSGKANLNTIRTKIISMLGYFTVSNEYSSVWTTGSMSTAIGYDLTIAPVKVNQAAYWQAMQDALDRMTYIYGTWKITADSYTATHSDIQSTVASAYSDRATNSGLPSSMPPVYSFAAGAQVTGPSNWIATILSSATWTVGDANEFKPGDTYASFTINPTGTMSDAVLEYTTQGEKISGTIDCVMDGEAQTIGSGVVTYTKSTSVWTLETPRTITATATIPSSNPFVEESSEFDFDKRRGITSPSKMHTYIDISAELTDQA